MTWSGRFDLYRMPERFGRMRLPPVADAPRPAVAARGTLWLFLGGVLAVVLLAWGALRFLPRTEPWTTRANRRWAVGLASCAAVVFCAPGLARFVDEYRTTSRYSDALDRAASAAQGCLDVDSGPGPERARRVADLLQSGRTSIRPRYRFTTVPTTTAAAAVPGNGTRPPAARYGIAIEPGTERMFPLRGPAPNRLRADLSLRGAAERDTESGRAAAIGIAFEEGPSLEHTFERGDLGATIVAFEDRAGQPLRHVTIRNVHPFRPLVIDGLFGERDGAWRPLPLAAITPDGVPIDVWRGTPRNHIAPVQPRSTLAIDMPPANADRLWVALAADGAYPQSAYGFIVATIRVFDREGQALGVLELVNGRDVADPRLTHIGAAARSERPALEWLRSGRDPLHYTLHSLRLDPAHVLGRVEITDHGALKGLEVAAVTLGRRERAPTALAAELTLAADRLQVRPDVAATWNDVTFRVRAPDGSAGRLRGAASGIVATRALRFPTQGSGALEALLPRGSFALALENHRFAAYGLAAFLAAFAAVLLGAQFLQRARRLRIKMLIVLGAATVIPLAFLIYFLAGTLRRDAETEQEGLTRAALRATIVHVDRQKDAAREMAFSARDSLELLLRAGERDAGPWLREHRETLAARGAFLRTLGVAGDTDPSLHNVAFLDTIRRSGLYYSPWDGLLALGLARGTRERVCMVGVPSSHLLPEDRSDASRVVLFGPSGQPVAGSRGVPRSLRRHDGVTESAARVARLRRLGGPAYESSLVVDGRVTSAAFRLVRDGDRIVGMLGLYRSRAETERAQASALRTVVLSGLAALLLLVVAGGFLVERVTDRLQRVTRAARSLAQGDWTSRVPVEGEDEVGRLAASFNTMADALDDRARTLETLHRGMHELTAALDRRAVAETGAQLLARATGAPHVAVYGLDRAAGLLDSLHTIGDGAPLGQRVPESGPAADALDRREPVQREGRLFVPLAVADRAIGLAVCSPVSDERPVDKTFLDASARQIGVALENARLYRAAVTDETTGAYTNAYFMRRLREEVDRAAVSGRPLTVARIAIRDFARVTRAQGAPVAHRFAAEVARLAADQLPSRDLLAHRRPGELLLLMPERDAAQSARQIDRLHDTLRRHTFDVLGDDPVPAIELARVHFPRDGAAADILLDALESATLPALPGDGLPTLALPADPGVVLGKSATMRTVLEVVARVAPTSATVLVGGETGTGKEIIADLIQSNSDRADRPYVKVNCAAIPISLIETELFGHEKGAFTGADRRRIGRFEAAHRGTLFLDEIGELPAELQTKLLRVLQQREIERVGSARSIPVDVRIIAATNRSLADLVARGEFREDLYHRLHVVEVRVPPLRERREEIPHLVERFRQEFNAAHGLRVAAFAPDALDAMYGHAWPGNVRELRNVVERAMLLAPGATVEHAHVDLPRVESTAPRTAPIEGLTPRQEAILTYARAEGGVTNGDVVREENVSSRTALRELQRLVDRGLLVRVGRRRGAVYRPPRA
ncbi:MAG: sigma 54-interacting transcriptional regulator [Planctomycetota bacterium]|nr:sigma 54-interacting transcriptional regulator [Planctomycetota bacterium]